MEGRFDLYGTEYKLVEPENIEELMQAFEVKSALETHISGLMHDEDSSGYDSLLQEQIDYIREYAESLGEFDSSTLANNIVYLAKKHGIRVGELEDTRNNFFVWEPEGGVMTILHERFKDMGLITEEEDETAVYHPNHLNSDVKWVLAADIVSLECFDGKKDLVIIPYKATDKEELTGYDFIFVWEDDGRWCWEKVFYTIDDPVGSLKEGAKKLYDHIENSEFDAKLSPKVHQLISNYVGNC